MKLNNKTAIITGAASGIGKAIAEKFIQEGAEVLLVDNNLSLLTKTSEQISKDNKRVFYKKCDMSNLQEVKDVFRYAEETFKQINILVNNAGIMDDFIPLPLVTDTIWNQVMGVNLIGPFYACREVIPQMLRNQRGVILNIDSVGGLSGGKAGLAYTVSKHGLVGITKHIGYCYAESGIRCNAIAPGAVNTEIGKHMKPDVFGYSRFLKGSAAIPRTADPAEIAAIALFLVSDDASFVNGTVLVADGGWTAY